MDAREHMRWVCPARSQRMFVRALEISMTEGFIELEDGESPTWLGGFWCDEDVWERAYCQIVIETDFSKPGAWKSVGAQYYKLTADGLEALE